MARVRGMWARKQEGPFSLDRMLEGIEPVRATNAKKECCVKSLLVVSEVSVLEISGDSRGVKRRDHWTSGNRQGRGVVQGGGVADPLIGFDRADPLEFAIPVPMSLLWPSRYRRNLTF